MPDGAPPLLVAARPTIRVNGQSLPRLSANILRMAMREARGGLSSLEVTLHDILSYEGGGYGFGATPQAPLRLGAAIAAYAGDAARPMEIFQGTITAIEAEAGTHTAPLFTVLAEDRLFAARRARRSRTFEDASPADVARRIAQDHGLTPEIRAGLDAPVTTWAQLNESDLAFLRRVLARVDADLLVVGDRLQAGPIADEPRGTVQLRAGATLQRVRLTADLAEQATELRVGAFDPATGEAATAAVTEGRLGPGQGRDGPTLLRQALGETREHVGHRGPMTEAEARALGRALFGQRARRFLRVEGTAEGNPAIRIGTVVEISGVNPFFANAYTVTEATHRFDQESGYLTDFLAEGAFLGGET